MARYQVDAFGADAPDVRRVEPPAATHGAVAGNDAVAQDTPEDVWVSNNTGLEYGAIGEHETALSWPTRALELAVRTGDPGTTPGAAQLPASDILA